MIQLFMDEWNAKPNITDLQHFNLNKMKQREVKLDQQIEDIIENLKAAYINEENHFAWVVPVSFGKDSSLLCYCVLEALNRLTPDHWNRPVHIISSDTGLENPLLKQFVRESIEGIKQFAIDHHMQCISAKIVTPILKYRFATRVIGSGMGLPEPRNPYRWCTDSFKIDPVEREIKALKKLYGGIITFTGVRLDESIQRANNIEKYGEADFIFPSKNNANKNIVTRYESHPIVNVSEELLWKTLMDIKIFPWGKRFTELYSMYQNSKECPMTVGQKNQSCGTSRSGCVLCLYVSKDHMLEHFRNQGEPWAEPLLQLRDIMRSMLYDARFRMTIRKRRLKSLDHQHSLEIEYDILKDEQPLEAFYEPLVIESQMVEPDLALGLFNLEGRLFLLQNTLYYQNLSGVELVSEEELLYIQKLWQKEFDWKGNIFDVQPEHRTLNGALVLDKEYQVNLKETTIPNLIINDETLNLLHPDELIRFARAGSIKIHNYNNDQEEFNYVFNVCIDVGESEKTIVEWLHRAERKAGYAIPFCWQPVRSEGVFWNQIRFVVCRPGIDSYSKALDFMNNYLDDSVKIERHLSLSKIIKYQYNAVQILLTSGVSVTEENDQLLKELQLSTSLVNTAKLMIQYRNYSRHYSSNQKNNILDRIESSPDWYEAVWLMIMDKSDQHSVEKLYALGFLPEQIPALIKLQLNISDSLIYHHYLIRTYGHHEVEKAQMLIQRIEKEACYN